MTWGHWDLLATRALVSERFGAHDTKGHISLREDVRRMPKNGTPNPYKTTMYVPKSGLFDVFSINIAGPLPVTAFGSHFLLVCVEHLNDWPIVAPTKRATAETVLQFRKDRILLPFGAPKVIVSDNGTCFTAKVLHDYMEKQGTTWKTVLAYAPLLSEKAERMVGTIERGVRQTPLDLTRAHKNT